MPINTYCVGSVPAYSRNQCSKTVTVCRRFSLSFIIHIIQYNIISVDKSRGLDGCECVYSKDVRLPVQMQRAMAAEAEAAREAKAKVYDSSVFPRCIEKISTYNYVV